MDIASCLSLLLTIFQKAEKKDLAPSFVGILKIH